MKEDHALLVIMNDWMLNLDNNTPIDSVYLDFSKAFDCVPHRRLMAKLHAYGIRGQILTGFKTFYLIDTNMFQ